uniref:Uncharacterized protein n=1 Tax=Vannella robusta TaxID=1487602 RepID=A0A7S4I9H7_9EUKA
MALLPCFVYLFVSGVAADCSYYSADGSYEGSYYDSFESYYYCCGQQDRICTTCCSFSLVWPTVVGSIITIIIFLLMTSYFLWKWKREKEELGKPDDSISAGTPLLRSPANSNPTLSTRTNLN